MRTIEQIAQHYADAFEARTRNDGKEFVCLSDSHKGGELAEFVRTVHMGDDFDCLPNDWIYGEIADAFFRCTEYDHDKWEYINGDLEPEYMHARLLDWMREPYAAGWCTIAQNEGIVSTDSNIFDWMQAAQMIARRYIHESVHAWIEQQYEKQEEKTSER